MCLSQFFGNLSPFQIIVAIVTFVTGGYTFYKSFLERAKLAAYPGDRIALVLSADGGCRKFQLRTNLVNHAVKTGTLHRLEARITGPSGFDHRFQWRLFFEYVSGGQAVQPTTEPHPVSIVAKGSELLFVEFEAMPTSVVPAWTSGRYRAGRKCLRNLKPPRAPPSPRVRRSVQAAPRGQACRSPRAVARPSDRVA